MVNPRLHADQLEDPHAVEVGERSFSSEYCLQGGRIDNLVGGEPAAEEAVADWGPEMIEQPGSEAARRAFHAPVGDQPRKVSGEGAAGQRPIAPARPPLPTRYCKAGFDERLRH
jgi:hypothetical protein